MMSIEKTLAERGQRYGAFRDHAVIAQAIKDAMWHCDGWSRLAPDQKQALEVIADKMARILNGDPNYQDNWHDIIGYAKLVEDRLKEYEKLDAAFSPTTTPEPNVTHTITLEEMLKHIAAQPPIPRDDGTEWRTFALNSGNAQVQTDPAMSMDELNDWLRQRRAMEASYGQPLTALFPGEKARP